MGVGTNAGERVVGSKAFTWSSPLTQTNALRGLPANAMSVGSSPTRTVALTLRVLRSTTLTSSESWFTTQAVLSFCARTETGSSPTGTSPSVSSVPAPIAKTSRRASGVFSARSLDPSGVIASGWVCNVSKFRKSDVTFVEEREVCGRIAATRTNAKTGIAMK